MRMSLRKHTHEIYRQYRLKVKIENFIQFGFFFYIFNIYAQNVDCRYTLEPPVINIPLRNTCHVMNTFVNPTFIYTCIIIKMQLKYES